MQRRRRPRCRRRARWALAATMALVAAAAPGHLAAQPPRDVASLLAAGDTSAALEAYEAALRRRRRDADLHYRAGILYLTQVRPGDDVSRDRRAAEEHLRIAARLAPDSAQYWLGLATALRMQSDVAARRDVRPTLGRARDAAERSGSTWLAEIEYRLGRDDWERYEQNQNRYVLVDGTSDIDQDAFLNDWRYVEDLFRWRLRLDFRGLVELRSALDHLDAALAARPLRVPAAGLFVVALGELGRWDSAAAVTARLVEAIPDSSRAWALHGLALARSSRWTEARVAFERADATRPSGVPSLQTRLHRLLTRDTADPAADARYWNAADPLWSTPENEARIEALARLVYVDHRWSDDLRGWSGLESDRGAVYARYGPPETHATLGAGTAAGGAGQAPLVVVNPGRDDPDADRVDAATRLDRERVRVLWIYERARRRYIFAITPGFGRAVFGGDTEHGFTQHVQRVPLGFDAIAPDSLPVQVFRFRDVAAARTEMALFTSLGPGIGDRENGPPQAFLAADTAVLDLGAPAALPEHTWRWRSTIAPGPHTVRVEVPPRAGVPAGRRGSVSVAGDPVGTGLATSDLMTTAPLPDSATPARWFDVLVPPVAAFEAGRPVTLLWEVYPPRADDGRAAFDVEVRVTAVAVERRGLAARIIGGVGDALGLSAEGDEMVTLRYRRAAPWQPAMVEYVTLDLGVAAPGTYRIDVTVRGTGAAAEASREIRVTAPGR